MLKFSDREGQKPYKDRNQAKYSLDLFFRIEGHDKEAYETLGLNQ